MAHWADARHIMFCLAEPVILPSQLLVIGLSTLPMSDHKMRPVVAKWGLES